MYTKLSDVYNRSDSGIGIAGNRKEFRGIPSNSVRFRFSLIPEFRSGIAFRPHPHVRLCLCRLFIGISKQFRNGIPESESLGIGSNSREFRGIPSNSVRFRNCSTLHVHQTLTRLQSIRFRFHSIPEFPSGIGSSLDGYEMMQ
jgi:hypothetical protein